MQGSEANQIKRAHFGRLHAHEAASSRSHTRATMRDGYDSNGIRTRLQVPMHGETRKIEQLSHERNIISSLTQFIKGRRNREKAI